MELTVAEFEAGQPVLKPYRDGELSGLMVFSVMLGLTVSTQAELDAAAHELNGLHVKGWKTWLNIEPVKERLDFNYPKTLYPDGPPMCCSGIECGCMGKPVDPPLIWGIGLSWLRIAGDAGRLVCPDLKSGHPEWSRLQLDCQPTDLDFVRDLCRQAEAAGVPVWIERIGARPFEVVENPESEGQIAVSVAVTGDGSDPVEWPEDLRKWRQTPGA